MQPPSSKPSSRRRAASLPFRPRARLLLLLGDQLIRDEGIAAFELVKNAYDADAAEVVVELRDIDDPTNARVIVTDDGTGMDYETVTQVWLEPGTDNRGVQRELDQRTPRFHRLPLGEKGVGRFAAHKLGNQVRLVTRSADQPEVVVDVDWSAFEDERYLSDVKIRVFERPAETFVGTETGTKLDITGLRVPWTRRRVRELYRAIQSIQSPFEPDGSLRAELKIEPDPGWLRDLFHAQEALQYSLFRAKGTIEGNIFTYDYEFRPPPAMDRVKARSENGLSATLQANLEGDEDPLRIGPVSVDLHIFDRDPAVLAFGVTDRKGLSDFLDRNGGIRVYRDGIRVFDYGEPEDDWLRLGERRVNLPTGRISNNQVLGAVSLRLDSSQDLVEKTNREGFVEDEAYRTFRDAVEGAVEHVTTERNKDKDRIRRAYAKRRTREPVLEDLVALRRRLARHGLEDELGVYVDRVETQFMEFRDTLLTAAGAGLSLAMVIHEVEKGIGELNRALERSVPAERVRELALHLAELIEGLSYLTRRSGSTLEAASELIRQSLFNTEYRAQYHGVRIDNGLEKYGDPDFKVRCVRRLIISTLMNLIDNSLWWLKTVDRRSKRIYVGTAELGGRAIVVADNGPGFLDPPEYLVQPFLSRRPDGMGLGLHLANEVMKAQKGRLAFPEPGELDLPRGINGAVVALVFPRTR